MKETLMLATAILLCQLISGQSKEERPPVQYPAEEIQVHLTQTLLFPGEILAFKIYCTNPLFPDLELSRIAFIELVSDRNTSLLRKKILLEKGSGSGEFILPDNLESGIYTVLAYTNWLKNFGEEYFHRQDILIINPEAASPTMGHPSPSVAEPDYLRNQGTAGNPMEEIRLITDKNNYATRERVSLKMKLAYHEGKAPGGIFSVSVNRTEPVIGTHRYERPGKKLELPSDKMVYFPDFRGIRLTGKLEDNYGAIQGARIILSEPGPGTKIKSTSTDESGNFHFLLAPAEGEKDIVFTLPANNAVLRLEEPFWNGLRNPPVREGFSLDDDVADYLREKYFHIQLQDKFNQRNFMQGPQFIAGENENERFYHHVPRTIMMDDYVLLDSLTEYFYELIPSVKYAYGRGQYEIRVLDKVNFSYYEEKAGVFIDGVLYPDYGQVARIPVTEMNSINVLTELYYYQDFSFGGIIDLHTRKSDFGAVQLLPNMTRLVFPLASRSEMQYHRVDHALPDSLDRIPDFRYLICWEPDIMIGPSGEHVIHFYTGDVTGEYSIKVTGITQEGIIVMAETTIFVEQDPESGSRWHGKKRTEIDFF